MQLTQTQSVLLDLVAGYKKIKESIMPDESTITITLQEWKDFKGTALYAALIDELSSRYDIVLSQLIKGGDAIWTDDNMRGRLSEIEYTQGLVDAIICDLEIAEAKEDKGSSFMGSIINKFKRHEE